MAQTSLNAIQAAISTVLSGSVISGGSVVPVFDHTPRGQAYPYIVIGAATEVRFDTHDRAGKEVTSTIHVWSDQTGYKQALGIVESIDTLLDLTKPTVSGWRTVSVLNEFTETLTSGDGKLRHVVARYRMKVEKEA